MILYFFKLCQEFYPIGFSGAPNSTIVVQKPVYRTGDFVASTIQRASATRADASVSSG